MGDQKTPLSSGDEENGTSISQDASQYSIENDGSTQRQVSNDHDGVSLRTTKYYMIFRGPEAYRLLTEPPSEQWDTRTSGKETIENARTKLLRGARLKQPVPITVRETKRIKYPERETECKECRGTIAQDHSSVGRGFRLGPWPSWLSGFPSDRE